MDKNYNEFKRLLFQMNESLCYLPCNHGILGSIPGVDTECGSKSWEN